jgi:uncharacterized metal-binding protein
MKPKLIEHLCSLLLVTAILLSALFTVKAQKSKAAEKNVAVIKNFLSVPSADSENPFDKALIGDVMNIYYPGQEKKNGEILSALYDFKARQFSKNLQRAYIEEKLTSAKLVELSWMFLKFFIVYAVVMLLTYYGVQTIGVWLFVRKKARSQTQGTPVGAGARITRILGGIGQGIAAVVLFSPAYVIAYTMRTEFNTDTIFFMALLAVISNGLLITYANKFYAFLVAESRKGYVETAVVKNMHAAYGYKDPGGISRGSILRPVKKFSGHVFGHIFKNAQHQYLATIKEQASFLITGLIIIEMALNIHGHLSYEMLRQILYRNYDIVLVIILGIFYVVKMTEIVTDALLFRQQRKFENASN